MKRARRKFRVLLKAKVAIEAIKNRSGLQELASKFQVGSVRFWIMQIWHSAQNLKRKMLLRIPTRSTARSVSSRLRMIF
jgi:transposase-like protein